jgi:hypothetical protein
MGSKDISKVDTLNKLTSKEETFRAIHSSEKYPQDKLSASSIQSEPFIKEESLNYNMT